VNRSLDTRRLRYVLDLLYTLVVRDIHLRYRRSVLGMAWSLLNPLLQLAVFDFVFRVLLPLRIPDYTLFLFTGLLAWTWFQSSLVSATGAIVDNAALVKQPGFPESVLPIVAVLSNLVNFALSLPILAVFLVFRGHAAPVALLALPLVIAAQFVFTLSLAFLLASIHVSFRDTQYLLGIVLMLGFYLAPVFYDVTTIPPAYRGLYGLNPLAQLITSYRNIFLKGTVPEWLPLAAICAGSGVLLAVTWRTFSHARHRFVEEL
jgi:lipopolysaccharide transport system permease protein